MELLVPWPYRKAFSSMVGTLTRVQSQEAECVWGGIEGPLEVSEERGRSCGTSLQPAVPDSRAAERRERIPRKE